jgi:hypothetical protein
LSLDDSSVSYAIIRYNARTYQSAGVMAIVRGKRQAESALQHYSELLDSSEYQQGWRYFLEKTTLKAGTDPTEATNLRQAELERRESQAPPEN